MIYKNASGGVSTTSGTGPLVISGSIDGYALITADFTNGQQATFYAVSGASYMVFEGTYNTAGTSITINTVLRSSNSNTPVNWSGSNIFIYVVAPASVFDKVEYISVTEAVDLDTIKVSVDPFNYKADGEAIAILAIGDSNMVGIGDSTGTMTLNTSVYVRSTPGTSAWNAADLAWFNNSTVDPAGVTFPNMPTAPVSFTGVLRNNNGNTGYAIATRLQQLTGRTVYLFQTACGGKTMAYWLPGGGAGKEGMNALVAQLPDAFAEMVNGPSFFDVVIMSDSTNDAGTAVSADTFLTNFQTVYDEFVTQGWIDTKYTRWLQLEAPQVYPSYSAGWLGLQYVSHAFGERVSIISSVDIATVGDNTHFTGLGCQTLGYNAADCVMAGLTPKNLMRPNSYIEAIGGLKQDLDCNLYDLIEVDTIHGSSVADTSITVRVAGSSSYDMVYTPNSFLAVTGLRTGGANGSWLTSRMTASAAYPAFRILADNTLSGSASLLAVGDASDQNRFTISRTGQVGAKGATWTGGQKFAYRAISGSGNQAVTTDDHIINVTTTSGSVTLDLPTAVGNAGLHFIIKRTGNQNITVDPNGSQTIDGVTTKAINTIDHVLEIVSNGANWISIKEGAP